MAGISLNGTARDGYVDGLIDVWMDEGLNRRNVVFNDTYTHAFV
jgi:hypothetical protein